MASDKGEDFGSFRKNKSFAKISLNSIALQCVGQELGDDEVKWLSLKVTEEIKKLLNEAGKYARRTRDDRVRLPHLQHASRNVYPDIFFNLFLSGELLDEEAGKAKPGNESIPKPGPQPKIPAAVPKPANIPTPPSGPLNSGWLKQKRAGYMKEEWAELMPDKNLPLTKEQLDFYQMITESGVGASEAKRQRALHALSKDPTVAVLLPKLSVFIGDAVEVNVCEQNILYLFYLLRMIKALLDNSRLNLHGYLHLFLPAVLSCLLTKEFSIPIGKVDHWVLREYAGRIATEMVRRYEAYDSGILPRVIGVYKNALLKKPLTTVYGAVIGLGKMGNDAVRACILSQLIDISERIEPYLLPGEASSSISNNTLSSKFISHRLMKMCSPLLDCRPRDKPEVYTDAFGFIGHMLRCAVILSRIKECAVMVARGQAAKKQTEEIAEKQAEEIAKNTEDQSEEIFYEEMEIDDE